MTLVPNRKWIDPNDPVQTNANLNAIPLLTGRRGLTFSPLAAAKLKLWILNGRCTPYDLSESADTVDT